MTTTKEGKIFWGGEAGEGGNEATVVYGEKHIIIFK